MKNEDIQTSSYALWLLMPQNHVSVTYKSHCCHKEEFLKDSLRCKLSPVMLED